MYFNKNNNTDDNFENNSLLSKIFKKKKITIIITFIIILIILIILFTNKNNNKMKTTNYLTLEGNETITLYQGNDYIEPGYKAYNSNNKDLSNKVIIDSNLNTKEIGEYEIKYTLDNVSKKRKIIIVEKPKSFTYIYLFPIDNDIDVYLNIGEKYNEPGYKVFSNNDDDLTDKVQITGNVDTTKKGNYKLTYSVIDNDGVTVSKSRIITVMDTEINYSFSKTELTNNNIEIKINIIDELFDYMILPDNSKTTNNKTTYKVTENGKYTFTSYNKKGIKKEEIIEVNNIDKTPPTGTCSGYYKNGKTTINVNANDNYEISKYVINNKEYTTNTITIEKEIKNANLTIHDNAGNTKEINCQLESKNSKLEMHFIASGAYDDAILIRTDDKTILIDSGQWFCRNYVTPYLKKLGITKIDAVY